MNSSCLQLQQPLALATSQIHRCRSVDELQSTFLKITPEFVSADAYGLYTFDNQLETKSIISHQANDKFLAEYEAFREKDPLFKFLLRKKSFTHSLDIFSHKDWLRQPLHSFLSRWGLHYSIEAPLIHEGRISGTMNFALGGDRYFSKNSLIVAQFLCNEFDMAYKRIQEFNKLMDEVNQFELNKTCLRKLPTRAQQVLELVIAGLNNSAIAKQLSISENTVRYHIKQIYRQFDVHNRAQLVNRYYQQ